MFLYILLDRSNISCSIYPCFAETASTTQSLLLIRCCGSLVPEEPPTSRTNLVQEVWKMLQGYNVSLDISHYNALLRVYLENEHSFNPMKFLQKLEEQNIKPNRVTFIFSDPFPFLLVIHFLFYFR